MKKALIYGSLFLSTCWMGACHNDDDNMPQESKQIILQDNTEQLKDRVSHENSGLISINGGETTNQRNLSRMSTGRQAATPQATADIGSEGFSLALVAEVYPPEYQGNLLRATHVAVSGNYAYVTYNTEGDTYLGGIDVIDISDINNPQLVLSAELPNVDLSSVAVDGDQLLLAGAADVDVVPELTTPAWVASVTLQGGMLNTSYDYTNLAGYVGTDITYNANSYYAVSGDNGVLAKLNKATREIEVSIDLGDLRAVRTTGTKVVVLSGTQGIHIYSEDLSPGNVISTDPDIPFSKRTIDFYQDYILASEGAKGLGIYDINSGSLFKQVEIPPYGGDDSGIDPADVVTNAVSANGDNIFVANGGAGIAIYHFDSPSELRFLGSASFQAIDQSSSNFVISRDNYVFVASGRGGLKILKMVDLAPTVPACNGTYDPYTGSTQYDLNINSGETRGYSDNKEFASNVNVGGTLNWCGSLKINGNNTNINGNGIFNIYGTLIAQGISVNGTMNMNGTATVGGDLRVNSGGQLHITGNLSQGNSGSNATLQVDGRLIIEGELVCYGNLSVNGNGVIEFANANSKLIVYGNVTNNGQVVNGSITEI